MKLLLLLLDPKIHPALQKDLANLATSANSLQSVTQNDEREVYVYLTLEPSTFTQPLYDVDITSYRVSVLFPYVIVRGCLQVAVDLPVGLLGSWISGEVDLRLDEICVYEGDEISEWNQVIQVGEAEVEDRMVQQEIEANVKMIKELEDKTERLKPELGYKRIDSFGRRNSVLSGNSVLLSLTSIWLGTQDILYRE